MNQVRSEMLEPTGTTVAKSRVTLAPCPWALAGNGDVRQPEAGRPIQSSRFDYRLVAPLFDHQGMFVCATGHGPKVTTEVRDRAGRLTARGTLTVG